VNPHRRNSLITSAGNVVTAHLYFDNLGGVQETEGDEPAVGAVG